VTFKKLINNKFGNFVIQKALEVADEPDKLILISEIEQNIPKITNSRIRKKWKNLYDKKLKFVK